MKNRRVVITGLGIVSPLGVTKEETMAGFAAGKSAVRKMDGWSEFKGLQCLIGAPAPITDFSFIPRKMRRSMGRISMLAAKAAEDAAMDAGFDRALCGSGRVGCVVGSTMGSAEALTNTFETMLPNKDLSLLSSMSFFQSISHTAAMNVAQYLGINGFVLATCAACVSATQAIGTGFDLVRNGRQDIVLCGGAEELHPTASATFDILFATSSHFNDDPTKSPRPFDKDRDGVVCGEGCGILVLEEYEHAKARGAKIYAELVGYESCSSGDHVSQSNHAAMARCMKNALDEAGLLPSQVDYVNAHATATTHGDPEEAAAIKEVFGSDVPVSSLKGYIGHTMGASGSIELAASLLMMQSGVIVPTRNLDEVAADCAGLLHVTKPLAKKINVIVKNSFAFGGISATLVCKKI